MKIKINNINGSDFETLFNNYIIKIYKKLNINIHSLNKIIRIFFSRLNVYYGNSPININL